VPTTRPRYTITDTGDVEEMLDLAERLWPGVERKELLLRLTRAGREAIARELDEGVHRREQQRAAMRAITELVDVDVLLSDDAWR
jgi:hypothetical protein